MSDEFEEAQRVARLLGVPHIVGMLTVDAMKIVGDRCEELVAERDELRQRVAELEAERTNTSDG